MSGCPNGCSQHHIANIGFYGASIKVGDNTIPAYIPHLGGSYDGRRGGLRRPAEVAPARQARARRRRAHGCATTRTSARTARSSTTSSARRRPAHFEELLDDLSLPVEFSLENMNHFIDWNRSEPYQVIRGEGECAV